ncbi:uncharacterized protein YALI1_B16578g [Yarrowia lipolytica]|uniref:Uncharacterized protein n=1 Tax=Yarrowia lipolytica TaxID=4952 RepID=A0A1D8N7I8_YARLL|nr:hypothetical protein YALI1_B16578g [Yarrowia lipolytica]
MSFFSVALLILPCKKMRVSRCLRSFKNKRAGKCLLLLAVVFSSAPLLLLAVSSIISGDNPPRKICTFRRRSLLARCCHWDNSYPAIGNLGLGYMIVGTCYVRTCPSLSTGELVVKPKRGVSWFVTRLLAQIKSNSSPRVRFQCSVGRCLCKSSFSDVGNDVVVWCPLGVVAVVGVVLCYVVHSVPCVSCVCVCVMLIDSSLHKELQGGCGVFGFPTQNRLLLPPNEQTLTKLPAHTKIPDIIWQFGIPYSYS